MSISRRDFMSLIGSSVAGAAALTVGSRYIHSSGAQSTDAASLKAWRVSAVDPVEQGAVPIVLENTVSGETLRVDICRKGSRLSPVAQSQRFDLFLANGGNGASPTRREHTLVVRSLARRLDAEGAQVPNSVLSMDARLAEHPELFDTSDDIVNA